MSTVCVVSAWELQTWGTLPHCPSACFARNNPAEGASATCIAPARPPSCAPTLPPLRTLDILLCRRQAQGQALLHRCQRAGWLHLRHRRLRWQLPAGKGGGEGRGGEGGCTGAGRTWEACAVLPESVDGCVLHSMKVDNGIFCKFCLELVQTQGVDWRRRSGAARVAPLWPPHVSSPPSRSQG